MSRKQRITSEQVRQLAALSRLTLTSSQEEELRSELSSILDYFDAVDSVDNAIEPEVRVVEPAALRADKVGLSDPEGVLKGVPQRKGRLVKAPRVF